MVTDLAKVRALIPDTATPSVFTDNELDVYLELAENNVYIAAALAIEAVASSDVMVYRILRTDDLSVDGVAGAKVLLARAQDLRSQGGDFEFFDIIYPVDSGLWAPEATARPTWL